MTRQRLLGRVVSDSALYGISAAIAKALALLTVPYLARALSPAGYGIADLATSTAALLTLVAMFAGDIPAARQYGLATVGREQRRVLSAYIWASAMVGMRVAILLLPMAAVISGTMWGTAGQAPIAALSLLLVPVSAAQASLVQTLRIQSRPVPFAALSLVDLLAQLSLAVVLVAIGLGPTGVVLGFVLGSLVGLLVAAVAARETLRVSPDLRIGLRLLSSGIQFLPHVAAFVVADWAVRSVVANGIGAKAVAELGLAIRVASVLSLVGAAFAMAWGPIGLARPRDSATARHFGQVLAAYGAASVAAALVLAAVGPELLPVVAGPGYEGAALILPGFALAYALAGTEYVLVVAAGVSDRAWRVALAVTIGAVVQVATAVILVPEVGIGAVGPVVVLGRIVSFSILFAGVRSIIVVPAGMVLVVGPIALMTFAAVQATAAHDSMWMLVRWALAIAVMVVSVVYFGGLLRSRRERIA